MISEKQIDWAIAVLEDPNAIPFTKEEAARIAEAFIQQEERTLDWMQQCYLCCDLARLAEQRYGNRARTR